MLERRVKMFRRFLLLTIFIAAGLSWLAAAACLEAIPQAFQTRQPI